MAKANKFANGFLSVFKQYTEEVSEAIVDEVESTANDGKELLRQTLMPEASKSGTANPIDRRTWKKYASSWYVKEKGGKDSNFVHCTIHNKNHYQLTHLLEYGHATRNGLRTREFRHIEPISLYCENKLIKNIPEIIKKGGKL